MWQRRFIPYLLLGLGGYTAVELKWSGEIKYEVRDLPPEEIELDTFGFSQPDTEFQRGLSPNKLKQFIKSSLTQYYMLTSTRRHRTIKDRLAEILMCPLCKSEVEIKDEVICKGRRKHTFPIVDGMPKFV
jgi:hypothetical protein